MFSAHAIHVLIRNTLIFLVTFVVAFFMWLYVGIKIDTLSISHYQVNGLYIKLDKKLTLKADKIIIPKRKASPSAGRIDKTLENIKYVLTFFDHIDLKKIYFNNNILNIYYLDNVLQLSSKDYLVRGNIHREGKMLKGDISALQLKQYDIVIRGEFSYDLHEDILQTEGKFLFKELTGSFLANKVQNKVDFSVKSDTFSDLRSVIDQFSMPEAVRSWVVDKVQAKSYKLLSLSGKGNIENKAFKIDMDALKGKVLFSDVTIDFKENVPPVVAPSFILSYTNDKGLFFDLEKPRYLGKNLDGSSVAIVHLRDDNTTLNLNLKFNTSFDKEVQKLLQAYAIHIPVLQKNGTVKASLDIGIGLKKDYISVVTDVNFTKGEVLIQKVPLPVVSGNMYYENGFITLKKLVLKNAYYSGTIDGEIDLKKKKLKSVFDLKYLNVGDTKDKFIDLKKQKLSFTLDYNKGIKVQIPKLTMDFIQKEKAFTLNISDLDKVKSYISKSVPIENGGEVSVTTKDFEQFYFKGIVKRNACFLYEKDNICNTRVLFEGKASAKDVDY
jgi:hypothetical protein